MNKMIRMLAVGLVMLASAQVWAAKDKVAVFDVQEAILNTNKAREQMKAFEARADVAKMIKDAEKLQKEIAGLRDEAAKGSDWSAQKKAEHKKSIEFKQADFELIVRKLNSERQQAGKKLMEELGPKLETVVKQVVEEQGVGLLLDRKAAIHADAAFDITGKVTEKLNAGGN